MFSRPRRTRPAKKKSKFAEQFAKEQEEMKLNKKDESEKRGIAYVFPLCKKHIPKPQPVKMKLLFCSKKMQGLSVPVYE